MTDNNSNLFISNVKKLSDLEIQQKYLNALEWTEIIIKTLPQLEDEFKVLKIINLALEVDLILGATLASAINGKLQPKVIKLITDLHLSEIVLIELLIKTKSKYALSPLTEILNTLKHRSQPSFYDQYKIKNILNFIKNYTPDYLPVIILQILQERNYNFRGIFIDFLSNCDIKSVNFSLDELNHIKDLLKQEIKNNDSEICALAFKCLVDLKDSWTITEFKNDYFNENPCYLEKWSIIDIFSKTEDESLVEYLIYALFEDSRSCCYQAIEALKTTNKIKEELVIDLLLHRLCQIIEDQEDRSVLNMVIGKALNEISPDKSLEKLALMAQCNDIDVRLNSIEVLKYIHHKIALQLTIKSLDDSSEKIVIEAFRNLYFYCQRNDEKIRNILSINTLINYLRTNNIEIFRWILDIITQRYILYPQDTQLCTPIADQDLIYPILLKKLQDEDKKIRIEAIYNLGYFDNEQVKHKLYQLIKHKDPQIQAYAAYALGKIGDKQDIPLLITKLKHSEAIVREGTVNGLRLMNSELAKQPLIEALLDKNPDVQKSISRALSVIGGKEIEKCLIELIQNTDNNEVADHIVFTLGIIGTEETVKFLHQVLQNILSAKKREDIKIFIDPETIINALEGIGTPSAIEVILKVLPHTSYFASFANIALNNIGGLDIIPHLWEIQLKSETTYLFDTIFHIQKSYQYYNPQYCETMPQNVNSNAIQKYRNYLENNLKHGYDRLSDYP